MLLANQASIITRLHISQSTRVHFPPPWVENSFAVSGFFYFVCFQMHNVDYGNNFMNLCKHSSPGQTDGAAKVGTTIRTCLGPRGPLSTPPPAGNPFDGWVLSRAKTLEDSGHGILIILPSCD